MSNKVIARCFASCGRRCFQLQLEGVGVSVFKDVSAALARRLVEHGEIAIAEDQMTFTLSRWVHNDEEIELAVNVAEGILLYHEAFSDTMWSYGGDQPPDADFGFTVRRP